MSASPMTLRAREHSMKRWRRAWKLKLIEDSNPDWRDLTDELNALAVPALRSSVKTLQRARDTREGV